MSSAIPVEQQPQLPPPSNEVPVPVTQAQPVQEPAQQQESPEDRILTVDETMRAFRGQPLEDPAEQPQAVEQAEMVNEFFNPPAQAQEPAGPPAAPPPGLVDQAVAQTMAPAPAPAAQGAQVPAQQQQVQGQPQAQQVPVQQTPGEAALQAQNAFLSNQIAALQAQATQAQAAPAPAAPAPPTQAPQYNMQVPPAILAGIASDDPNVQGAALNQLINGVAETVSTQVRGEMDNRFQQVPQQIQPMLAREQENQRIQQDMYGTYPELNGYREYVVAAAKQLEPTYGTAWSPQLRDAIAERVSPMVPGLYQRMQHARAQQVGLQQVQPQVQPQPQQYQNAQPPVYGQQYPYHPANNPAQPLPQQYQNPQTYPPGVQPVGMVGGTHLAPAQPAPMLVRDANGQLVQVTQAPQPFMGGSQTRPNGSPVDPELADIWHTLQYT